ncbi:MAG: DsbE family thiol:disulfide interchange protein [Gammaproteobacteria bacterium]|nr:MAG: DsbE family thiol:disulfide interchange protein [Gammaproteobacteria bacterium]
MNRKRILLFSLPLLFFGLLVALFLRGLELDPRRVPSPLIGKPAPTFTLPRLHDPAKTFSTAEMKGKVWLLNVWASWCVACRDEQPLLVDFAQRHLVPIVGLDYKDDPRDGKRWLAALGDPYDVIAVDASGRVGIDWGVYGVPETFVIDKHGIIRHKVIGPIQPEILEHRLLPLIRRLQEEPA